MKNGKTSAVFFGSMRLPFVVLTPTCVSIGIATAYYSGAGLNIINLILILIGALSAHISVNALNEYHDFKSGLDLKTEPTPFSGGSKSIPENPEKASVALATGIITLVNTALIGTYFAFTVGLALLPIGVLGIIIIVTYTKWITHNPILCLLAPGVGFGILMVMGTHFVLTGEYTWTSFAASLVPSFLVSNLLLINQIPDVKPDKSVGRKHFPISIGINLAAWLFTILLGCCYVSIIVSNILGLFPTLSLIALATIAIAVPMVKGIFENLESVPDLIPHLGKNVVLILVTNILLSLGIFLG